MLKAIRALGLASVLVAFCTACQMRPPEPPAPRTATRVAASFGKTWDVLISVFADRRILIQTLDRSSGLIIADAQPVAGKTDSIADCGTTALGASYRANAASWNVVVRGDSTQSTIKATVRFVAGAPTGTLYTAAGECSSRGTWEIALERGVKSAAESRVAARQ
jgi:hypothetical protein